MSLPPSVVPSARSAYRSVLRAARITFAGDPSRRLALQTAVRQTFSSPTLTAPASSPSSSSPSSSSPSSSSPSSSTSTTRLSSPVPDPTSLEELTMRVEEWREVAIFLRKNVVQGVLNDSGAYKLRVTEDTELGDNASIRNPSKLPTTPFPNRTKRRRHDDGTQTLSQSQSQAQAQSQTRSQLESPSPAT